MSIKVYGIFLAYPPTVNLRHEGLGRYLVAFLKAAANKPDIRFLVASPSWLKDDLLKLCKSEGVPLNSFDLMSPTGKPSVLRFYELYKNYKSKKRKSGRLKSIIASIIQIGNTSQDWMIKQIVTSRSFLKLMLLLTVTLPLLICMFPLYLIIKISQYRNPRIYSFIEPHLTKLGTLLIQPKKSSLIRKLYRFMEQGELDLMIDQINECTHVNAWYCHTAFWPSFNRIETPRLMCVPDVLLADFPVGFSHSNQGHILENFKAVEEAIHGAENIITYSNHIKENILIKKYGINPATISVVRHATNDLSPLVMITGFKDNEASSRDYCQSLLLGALQKASNYSYASIFRNKNVKFFFYASQFRPSKNIISLLQSYKYLLRKQYVGHKLILTGDIDSMPSIRKYIDEHKLKNDVICLHGLTTPELAACYKLADLAINPSLSEGGCPFTFTEALSVQTPVVMAKIPVTEEIIHDELLKKMMLFDPYDWKSMAERITWALANRKQLLSSQLITYAELSKRNWVDVVDEHIEILDRISATGNVSSNQITHTIAKNGEKAYA